MPEQEKKMERIEIERAKNGYIVKESFMPYRLFIANNEEELLKIIKENL